MRKILFSAFAGGIILLGCSKSSDSPASIVGTWQVNHVYAKYYINNQLSGSDTATTGTLTFDNNGTVTAIDLTDTTTGTYNYNTSSKVLTVIESGDTSMLNVTNLTSSDLHYTGEESGTSGGFTLKATVDADYKR